MRARSTRPTAPRRRSLLALVAALAVVAATFAAAPAQADPGDGTATWGLHQSFRNYITGVVAHGTIQATDGATWQEGAGTGQGPFAFPVTSAAFTPSPATGQIALGGSVYLAGHDYGAGYVLELRLSDLVLDIAGSVGTLYADVTYRPFVSANPSVPPAPEEEAQDVAFATVDLSGVSWVPDGTGAYTITDAPTVGVAATMHLIGWDLFYPGEYPNVVLDPFSLTFTPGDTPPAPSFSDVGRDHRFYEPISWMAGRGITAGYQDGTFRPNDSVTRQTMAAFLYRYAGEPPVEPGGPTFSDVQPGHQFYDAISWMAGEGITTGYQDGSFRPTELLTRQSVAAFLHRFAGEPPVEPGGPTFPDVQPGHQFYDAISWMAGEDITTGYEDGTFGTTLVISRQSAAAFLFRYDESLLR